MPAKEHFHHAEAEIQAGMLLQDYEYHIPIELIVPPLETLLTLQKIPIGGIPSSDHSLITSITDNPHVQQLLKYGLFDPNFTAPEGKKKQQEGKAVANIAGSLLAGKVMDNIYEEKFIKQSACSLENVYQKISRLSISPPLTDYVTEGYLFHAQAVLLDFFRQMLLANLKETLHEISQKEEGDPYKILCKNITKASGMTPYEFLGRGVISQTDNLYALLHYISDNAKDYIPIVQSQGGQVTRTQATQMVYDTRSAMHRGLAKNDVDLFRELENEGTSDNPQVPDALLTTGLRRDPRQGMFAPFIYRSKKLRMIPADKEGAIGIVVLDDVHKLLLEADELAFQHQLEHHETIRAEPRIVTGCPARAPRADGKPNTIKYVHQLAVIVLQRLNQEYEHAA